MIGSVQYLTSNSLPEVYEEDGHDEIPPNEDPEVTRAKVAPRPMEGGMIRPYRMPQLPLLS